MCSCFISYPGFVRYHTPYLRSIFSAVNSGFKRVNLPNPHNGSSPPSKTKKLAIEDVKVTLGSRTYERSAILNPASVFAAEPDWFSLSGMSANSSTCSDNATRREYYEELVEKQRSQALHSPSPQSENIQGSINQTLSPLCADSGPTKEAVSKAERGSVGGSAWGNNSRHSNTLPTGYWHIMSLFRTKNRSSSAPTKTHSKSDDSAV
ncbi:hypothetical protein BDR22DRAFT_89564 [Usnea florida]